MTRLPGALPPLIFWPPPRPLSRTPRLRVVERRHAQISGQPLPARIASGDPRRTAPRCGRAWSPSRCSRTAGWSRSGRGRLDAGGGRKVQHRRAQRDGHGASRAGALGARRSLRPSAPDRPYWYRFTAGGQQSETGRTRRCPPSEACPDACASPSRPARVTRRASSPPTSTCMKEDVRLRLPRRRLHLRDGRQVKVSPAPGGQVP